MRNIKLVVTYDGTEFRGWQIQPDQRTVQATLEEAIAAVIGHQASLTSSGRTDAGVHALGHVANFRTSSRLPPERLLAAVNAHLPPDVVVNRVDDVPIEFNANRDARGKWYRYTILCSPVRDVFRRRYVYEVRYPLDSERMHRAARTLVGTHDFRCFETDWPNRATSVRTVTRSQVARVGELIHFDVEADGFLYNMVRAIVGSLVYVGRGHRPVGWLDSLLREGKRKDAGPTAPACGLCLMQVKY